MEVPLKLAFRGIDHSDAVEARIRKEAEKLAQFHDRIISCRVTVEAPHKRRSKGNLFRINLVLELPGQTVAVRRAPDAHHAYEDVYVTIRDAFDEARRRLQDVVRRRQGKVKRHEAPPHGRVVRLFPEQGYGFIEAADGREVYFHRNSVLNNGFSELEVGSMVRFHEEEGEEGAQASTVQVLGKHHIVD